MKLGAMVRKDLFLNTLICKCTVHFFFFFYLIFIVLFGWLRKVYRSTGNILPSGINVDTLISSDGRQKVWKYFQLSKNKVGHLLTVPG